MKKEKIVNLVNRNIGSAKKKYAKSDTIKYIDISSIDNIKNKLTGFTEYVFEKAPSRAQQCLIQNDILVSTVRPNLRNIAINDYKDDNYVGSSGFCVLRTNEKCDSHYLYYNLLYNEFTNAMISLTAGAAYPAIKDSDILNYEINVPSLPEQQKIAAHLDSIQSAIDNKKQQLQQLDELVKSKFVEMFGDVSLNDKNFDTEIGKNLFKFSSGKFLSAEFRLESGIPVYGGNGIAWYTEKPLIEYSTIIIGRVGAYCGNVKLVTEPVWITDNALFIKEFKTSRFILQFLLKLMENINFAKYAGKVAQPKITQGPLEEQVYIIPPIELQTTFAEYVQKIDSAKTIIKTQLVDLQELLDSKMNEYFGE